MPSYTVKLPTFGINIADDGALHMTWCFGEQGHPDSWRVVYYHAPDEGVYVQEIRRDPTKSREYEGSEAVVKLGELLREGGAAVEDAE
jgi:hypothetical protein